MSFSFVALMSAAVAEEPSAPVVEMDLDQGLAPHQFDVVVDLVSNVIVLEGGLGCGKTFTLLVKMVQLVEDHPGVSGLWVEPTHDLIGSILLPLVEEMFDLWGITWEYRTQWRGREHVLLIWPGTKKQTPVYLRSGDKPVRIVGFKCGWFLIDEADQMKGEVWGRCMARRRDKRMVRVVDGKRVDARQAVVGFTPEAGYRWTFDRFHDPEKRVMGPTVIEHGVVKKRGLRLITGVPTTANTHNPEGYVEEISGAFDDEDKDRVTTGKRSAAGGRAYRRFTREQNCRPCKNTLDGTVFIGADFNVGLMVWVVGRYLPAAHEIHFWGEVVSKDTDTIDQCEKAIALLVDEHARLRTGMTRREIVEATELVPDASCNQRRTGAQGTASDLDHLIKAGFDVRRPAKNPPVADRVFAMNVGFLDPNTKAPRIFVDAERCPTLTRSLEQQARDPQTGEPVKDGKLDAATDAAGYPVHFYEPRAVPRGNQTPHKRAA